MDKSLRKPIFQAMKKCLKGPVYIDLDTSPHIREELELEYIRDEDGTHYVVNIYDTDKYDSVWYAKYRVPVMEEMLKVFTEETKELDSFTLYVDYDYKNKTFELRI
jgi:hypothetical protein